MQIGGLTSGAVSIVRSPDKPLASTGVGQAENRQAEPPRSSHIYVPVRPALFADSAPIGGLRDTAASPAISAVDDAHRAAWSALNNDRFRLAMETLSDGRASDAVMMMRPVEGAGTDLRSALARYEENS
ncbi:hypothetical protein [Aminobacter sp. HY435]|uniref:hypothetical protein n=1 Tax=Aminobacter sp. HY435 TaxID=2970917 RepID=UPI0022B953D6|nr:hypothetical protein [Aminobacter sp. HY435]